MNQKNYTKILWVAGIGNALELYDYVLYAAMLPHLMPIFFPEVEWGELLGFLSFALTFLVAPLGAWGWGKYAKRCGTSGLLKTSILWMAFPSLGIALLPSYEAIGVWAPGCLMFLRLLQGISVSGEAMGAKLFAMESVPQNQQVSASGALSAFGALGVGLAMLMGAWVSTTHNPDAWRLPFLFGSVLFFVARWIRRLPVTQKPATPSQKSLWEISRANPYPSLFVCFLGAHLGITSYTLHAFINPFCMRFEISEFQVYALSLGGLLITALTAWVTGKKCSASPQSLYKLTFSAFLGAGLLSFPCLWLCTSGAILLTAFGYGILAILLGTYATTSAVLMFIVFKQEDRTQGVLFYYALGCAIFGGLTPFFLELLFQIHLHLPGVFLSVFGLVSLKIFCQLYRHVRLH